MVKEYIIRYEKDGGVAFVSIFAKTPRDAQLIFQSSNSARVLSVVKKIEEKQSYYD